MKLQTRIKRILTVAIGKRLEPGWRRDAANGIGKNYTYLSRVLNGRIETPGAVDCVDRLEKWIEAK